MAIVNRWYQILELLVSHSQISLQHMATELHISQKTLLSSIKQLNDVLEEDVVIQNDNNQLTLQVFNYNRLEDILSGSLKKESDFNSSSKRISYIIKKLIQGSSPILIDDLAEDIKVSRTTINKDLKKVRQLAQHYHIAILGTPNRGITVQGEELQLRLFYCYNVYPYFDTNTLQANTKCFLAELYQRYQIPKKIQDLLTRVIAISIMRLMSQRTLEKPIPYFSNPLRHSPILKEVSSHIETNYDLLLPPFEQDFLSFPLNLQYIDSLDYKEGNNNLAVTVFQNMMARIKDSFDLEIDDDKLFNDLHIHLNFLLNRLQFHHQTSDLFHGELKNKYPLAYQLASKAATVLEELFHLDLDASEISYLALYFEMGLRETKRSVRKQQRKIAVVCTTGRATATMINHQLRRVIGKEIIIDQYSEEAFSPDQREEYDAIFTTIPLKFQHINSPVIQITNLFNDQWLRNQWEQINQREQNYFKATHFQFMRLKPREHYIDYITEMADYLVANSYVDTAFTHNVVSREDRQSTIFGNDIAFPHATHSHPHIVLMVGILEETYSTFSEKVDIIFMLAIPEQASPTIDSELLTLYDGIFRIANNDDLKASLKSMKTTDALLAFIRNKGGLR